MLSQDVYVHHMEMWIICVLLISHIDIHTFSLGHSLESNPTGPHWI